MMERKNINRGFKQLRVWQHAIDLYFHTCKILTPFPFELKKTAGNCIDAANSISRNIAEGYCRKSAKEYIHFLYIALGSSGEYYSSICSFLTASQISREDFENLDQLHYETENELLQLIKSVQRKLKDQDWEEGI
jgi:four helix bundle protein